jgi:hypothetical protein
MCYIQIIFESFYILQKLYFLTFETMETRDMLEKILRREELSPADQIEILSLVRAEHIDES